MRTHKLFGIFQAVLIFISTLLLFACVEKADKTAEETPLEAEMVLIPGGEFMMGSDAEEGRDWNPAHSVYVDSFYMDKYEVTNAQYYEFCLATDHRLPEFWDRGIYNNGPEYPNHPVVGISWRDAKAYAEWAGKRLPTEAEWEYAAKGGTDGQNYPYGDEHDSAMANFKSKGTVRVACYPPNDYGLHDMSGNVNEWVADYHSMDYYKTSPRENPPGPESGKFKVIRGGGWHSGPYCCRVYYRNALPPGWVDFALGFRCAKDLHPPQTE